MSRSSTVQQPSKESRRRNLLVPREHGAWGLVLVPLVTGAAVGIWSGGRILPLVPLTVAALTLFWLRTPVESWLGTTPMRAQPGEERRLVRRMSAALTHVALLALIVLFWGGRNEGLLWIGAAAAVAFGSQALLKKYWRRARVAAQIVGTAGLTATAPAAYYVAAGSLDAKAWILWAANFLFAANQIQFVQLCIHTMRATSASERFTAGRAFLAAQILLAVVIVVACALGIFPWMGAVAFLPLLYRGFAWFLRKPEPLKVRALGWSELRYAIAFGVLLICGVARFTR